MSLFFIGRPYALSMKPASTETSGDAAASTASTTSSKFNILQKLRLVDSVVWCALVGIVVGCIAPLRDFLSERAGGPLRFVGSFSYNFGRAAVPLSTMILGASLYAGARAEFQKRRDARNARPEADKPPPILDDVWVQLAESVFRSVLCR